MTRHEGEPGQEGEPGKGQTGGKGGNGGNGGQGIPGPRGLPGKRGRSSKLFKNLVIIWIIAFSILVGWNAVQTRDSVSQNKNTINDLKKTKASVLQLQATNCGLVSFLIDAEKTRFALSKVDTGAKKKIDLQVVYGYHSLIKTFHAIGAVCKLPSEPGFKFNKGAG